METFYKLYFSTDQDKTASVKIPDAKETASPEDVKAAMVILVAGGIAGNKQGTFSGIVKAQFIQTQTVEFDVA